MKHSCDEVLSIFLPGATKILLRPLMEDILELCSNWSLGSSKSNRVLKSYHYRSIFAQFMTMREKQVLVRAIGIQKENWG